MGGRRCIMLFGEGIRIVFGCCCGMGLMLGAVIMMD